MSRKRTNYSAEFKSKLVLEMLKNEQSINAKWLASPYFCFAPLQMS